MVVHFFLWVVVEGYVVWTGGKASLIAYENGTWS